MHLAILAGDRHTMVGLLVACDVLAEKKAQLLGCGGKPQPEFDAGLGDR